MLRTGLAWLGAVIAATIIAGCGSGDGAVPTTSFASTTTTTTPSTTTLAPTTTAISVTTSTAQAVTTTTAPALPGDPIDFGPAAGDLLAVIGVAHDDVLNLRAGPGIDQEILDRIPPLHDALIALGETRELPGSLWIAVDYEGTDGWVNLGFIGYLGITSDDTAAIVGQLGEIPAAPTMLELGMIVAESLSSEEPPSDLVVSVAATEGGDLGEVTYDVIGLGDDAVRGVRAHMFGQPGPEGFTLDTVEATTLCGRGVTEDGFCV